MVSQIFAVDTQIISGYISNTKHTGGKGMLTQSRNTLFIIKCPDNGDLRLTATRFFEENMFDIQPQRYIIRNGTTTYINFLAELTESERQNLKANSQTFSKISKDRFLSILN